MSSTLPPCGPYRTTRALGDVPAGRLVYFHNHGEGGAGVYLPSGWKSNRAQWHGHGTPIPDDAFAETLEPLPAEGLYRVSAPFTCCAKNCRTFEADLLVQLGYNGEAQPIVFIPEWTAAGLAIPTTGTPVDTVRLTKLAPLKVAETHDHADHEKH